MKIVVLDGYTLNPGDLSWDDLEKCGHLKVFERTAKKEVVLRAKEAEAVFTNKTVLDERILRQLPKLRYIGVLATGYNVVDIQIARELGIMVCNVPGYGTPSVVQHTFALILELFNHVQQHHESVLRGDWANSVDFSYWNFPLKELAGKTIGIIGYGEIGAGVSKVAAAFDMKVVINSRTKRRGLASGLEWLEFEELLRVSDIVSLHCPLTPDTAGLMNKERIEMMKPSAFLINTSRGPLINEADLAIALNNETIAGAALDVLSSEPPDRSNPLFAAKNCLITPHIAWASFEARQRLMDITVQNFSAFMRGEPRNVIKS